jgi:predicted fused transcriptional regulator/phosphomethylpyrimidine kinase
VGNNTHWHSTIAYHSQENTTEITKEEIENAIKKMKMGRAAGHAGITPEQIKHMGNYGKEPMHKLLNLVWKKKCVPEH